MKTNVVQAMEAKFTIPGKPIGKGRHKFRKTGSFVTTYTPEATVLYENLVKLMYKQQCQGLFFQQGTAIDMRMIAYYEIPKSTSKKNRARMLSGEIRPLKKPDSSNVLKAVEDALNLIAYHDDTQIVDTQVRRSYSDNPRVVVILREATLGKQKEVLNEQRT